MVKNGISKSFLGANTPAGFFSLYDDFLCDVNKVYILKGGPGTGKNYFMRKFAGEAEKKGFSAEYIHCAFDPKSLDGVYIKELSLAICDGTPPHILEPPLPGAGGGIINLGEFWNEDKLSQNSHEIKELLICKKKAFSKAFGILSAAGKINAALLGSAIECSNLRKLNDTTDKLVKRTLRRVKQKSSLEKRFLTAISPDGVVFYKESAGDKGKNIVISDEYGLSALMLERIKNQCLSLGHSVIACYTPFSPESIEHIILPKEGIGFYTSNRWHPISTEPYGRIRIERFMNTDLLKNRRVRTHYLRKIQKELVYEAVSDLNEARNYHGKLEEYYKKSMDFSAVDTLCNNTVKRLLP